MTETDGLRDQVKQQVDAIAVVANDHEQGRIGTPEYLYTLNKSTAEIIALVRADERKRLGEALRIADVDLTKLRQRYDHEFEIPICHICGDEMSPGMIGEGRIEWGCYGKVEGGSWNEYKPGRSIADQHCRDSHRVTVPRGDMGVVRLIDTLAAIGLTEEVEESTCRTA